MPRPWFAAFGPSTESDAMLIFARLNHHGWIHLWRTREAFELGEASEIFFDPRTDPRWIELELSREQREGLARKALVALEDPGYLEDSSEEA